MKRSLRMVAALLMAGVVIFWVAAGMNRGWTKTQIPIKTVDPVTGLEGIQWQAKFVPGVDFLGAALLGSGILTAISFFTLRKPKQPPTETKT